MQLNYWKIAIAAIAVLSLSTIGKNVTTHATPNPVNLTRAQTSQQPLCNSVLQVLTPGGANLIVRTAPNSALTNTCMESGTSVSVKQYSADRQWTFVEAQWTRETGWQSINGWVRAKYLACPQ